MFSKVLPFNVKLSNREPVEQLIANLGFKDIKTGDAVFDRDYVL